MTTPAHHAYAPPAGIEDALQRIRDHGGRVTAGKRALAELIHRHDGWLTVDDIAVALGDHDRSAIYRNLTQFEELGIAEHLHLGHGQAVYRRAGLLTVPVLCSVCGATFDLDRRQTQTFARQVARHTGVRLDLTHFPLTGTCTTCTHADDVLRQHASAT
jgi:Fe2+ or Zn2+ uptake regulation protein